VGTIIDNVRGKYGADVPINCISVKDKLDGHFMAPELEVLKPDNQSYRCLLLQPSGPIYADSKRIGHLNIALAELRCKQFLELASSKDVELAITPEYCVPWTVLEEVAVGPTFPTPGRLWVLGCESATATQLSSFKAAVTHCCATMHEDLPSQGTYTDPLVYCFQTRDNQGVWRRVMLLQFKTCPSRDGHFLENEHLIRGKVIYQFQNQGAPLKLAAIICSDAFAVGERPELLQELTDRSILIHIQLNQNPRHAHYRTYRTNIFAGDRDLTNCDIVCLNWAQKIEQYGATAGEPAKWNNIAGSAWYLPLHRCATKDQEILRNHKMGLYYCYMEDERHALFFHYEEAVFELTVPKPVSIGFGVIANKQGPLMVARWRWADVGKWETCGDPADSGLKALIEADPGINTALSQVVSTADALAVERALALTCGTPKHTEHWFRVDQLDSCRIEQDEILRRITFAGDNSEKAALFRHERLQRAAALGRLLTNYQNWPPQVRDIQGAQIAWSSAEPNYNIHKAGAKPAVVVYLGENPQREKVGNVADRLLDLLRREGRSYWRRLAVCFRQNEELKFAPLPAITRMDFTAENLCQITEVLDSTGEE
jgi:hypothetical protein